jgi:hypothetical protein
MPVTGIAAEMTAFGFFSLPPVKKKIHTFSAQMLQRSPKQHGPPAPRVDFPVPLARKGSRLVGQSVGRAVGRACARPAAPTVGRPTWRGESVSGRH